MTTPQHAPIQTPATTEETSQDLATLSMPLTPKANTDIFYEHKYLNNGIGVHLSRLPYSPKEVYVTVCVLAGSGKQSDDQGGVAHFLEHMLTDMSTPLGMRIAQLRHTEIGAQACLLAATRGCSAKYEIHFPSENTAEMLRILGRQLTTASFSDEALSRERNVILTEEAGVRRFYDAHGMSALPALYPKEKGFPIVGSKENIESITRSDLLNFHREHYHGGNIALFVSGSLPENINDLVAEHFSEIAASAPVAPVRRVFAIWDDPHAQRYMVSRSAQTYVDVGMQFPAPCREESDYAIVPIVVDLLSCSEEAPMWRRLRGDSGLCYTPVVQAYSMISGAERLYLGFGLRDKDSIPRAFDAVRMMIDDITQLEFPSDAVKAAIARVKVGAAATWLGGYHDNLVNDYRFGGNVTLPEERKAALDKVTPEDVKRVSRIIFRDAFTHLYGDVDPTADYTLIKK